MKHPITILMCVFFVQVFAEDPVWKDFNGGSYYINTENSYTYDEAKHFCEASSSHLVIINNDDENSYLKDFAVNAGSHLWMGLDDRDVEGEMKWVDGSLVTYSDWNTGQPDNYGNNEDCGHFRSSDGKWNDLSCSNKIGFICEKGPLLQWNNFNGKSYYIDTDNSYTYNQATQFCDGISSHLAIINDEEENTFLKDFAVTSGSHLWIGLDDIAVEGEMKWVDGSLVTYSDWNTGQPDNYGNNEDCGHFRFSDGKWNDLSCSNKIGFICEKA
ncbi:C-type mannose receptor 2-like [Glandiceps talaboti]